MRTRDKTTNEDGFLRDNIGKSTKTYIEFCAYFACEGADAGRIGDFDWLLAELRLARPLFATKITTHSMRRTALFPITSRWLLSPGSGACQVDESGWPRSSIQARGYYSAAPLALHFPEDFQVVDLAHVFLADRRPHCTRDNLLRAQSVKMSNGKGLSFVAAVEEGS